jgi:hypothetical protein
MILRRKTGNSPPKLQKILSLADKPGCAAPPFFLNFAYASLVARLTAVSKIFSFFSSKNKRLRCFKKIQLGNIRLLLAFL